MQAQLSNSTTSFTMLLRHNYSGMPPTSPSPSLVWSQTNYELVLHLASEAPLCNALNSQQQVFGAETTEPSSLVAELALDRMYHQQVTASGVRKSPLDILQILGDLTIELDLKLLQFPASSALVLGRISNSSGNGSPHHSNWAVGITRLIFCKSWAT